MIKLYSSGISTSCGWWIWKQYIFMVLITKTRLSNLKILQGNKVISPEAGINGLHWLPDQYFSIKTHCDNKVCACFLSAHAKLKCNYCSSTCPFSPQFFFSFVLVCLQNSNISTKLKKKKNFVIVYKTKKNCGKVNQCWSNYSQGPLAYMVHCQQSASSLIHLTSN